MKRILQSFLAAGAFSALSCNQSAPPPAIAIAQEPEAQAKEDSPPQVARAEPKKADAPIVDKEPPPPADGGSFVFPDDAGGKSLAKTLTPTLPPASSRADKLAKQERRLPAFLNTPSPTLPDSASAPPRLPSQPAAALKPTALPDRVPVDLGGSIPMLPARSELPTGPLTKNTSRDVNRPADLPILSLKPVADRAPLTDPTIEFTAQSVISPTLPLRTEPTGFLRINLPDPFEHAADAKPRTPVVENPNRSLPK